MLRAAIAAIAILVTSSMLPRPAAAGIIPCTGQSLIKVMDVYYPRGLEGRHVLKLRDQNVHLGYLFKGCSGGEWVGFIAEGQPHVPLNDQQLRALLYVTGMRDLPPVPSYWASPQNYRTGVMWLILGLVVIIAAVLQQMGVMTRKQEETDPVVNFNASHGNALAASVDGIPTSFRSALDAVERAASEHTRVAISGKVPPPRQPSPQHAQVTRFGKR